MLVRIGMLIPLDTTCYVRSGPSPLLGLTLAPSHEAVDVAGHEEDSAEHCDEVHWHLDREVHLGVPGEKDADEEPVEGGAFHVFIGIIGCVPVEGDEPKEGCSHAAHDEVVPLVQLVGTVLEVVRHDLIGDEDELQAECGHEDSGGLESRFRGEEHGSDFLD